MFIFGVSAATDLPPIFENYIKPAIATAQNFTLHLHSSNITDLGYVIRVLDATSEAIGIFLVGLPGEPCLEL